MAPALSTRRIGDSVTLREALGGPWATHWLLWLAFYPPTVTINLIRESTTPYPAWWWPLLSATVQHLIAGLIVVGGGLLARRRRPILPVSLVAALWTASSIARGVVESAVAESVAGVPGDFEFRAITWIVMTIVWGPALVYGIAQVDRRRALIGELELTQRSLDEALAAAAESGEAMRARLARMVRRSVDPVLDDLLERLVAVRHDLDRAAFVEISMRLSSLHDETADLIESAASTALDSRPAARRASLREVFDVHLAPPWLTAGVVSLQTAAIVLPDGARIFGSFAAIEIILATIAGGLALGAVLQLADSWSLLRDARASSVTLAAGGAAILASSWVMLHSGIDPITWHGAIMLPVLGGGLLTACTVVIASIVIARANEDDERTIGEIHDRIVALEAQNESALERERHRLSELMHGPVQGRIAACVMALTFFSTDDAAPGALASITEQVLDHLAAASHDLSLLAEGRPPNGGV